VTIVHLTGIDPGLVHTGVVKLQLNNLERTINVTSVVVLGPDAAAVKSVVGQAPNVFVEKYEDRGTSFSTHGEMRAFERDLTAAIPRAQLLSNTGVKKVVTETMLDVIVGKLPTTNHQDLESAARIALYGGLKIPEINSVLYHLAIDHLAGRSWARS